MAKTTKPNGRSRSELKKSKEDNRVKKVKTMDKKCEHFERSQSEPNVSSSNRKKRAKFPKPVVVKTEATENLNDESVDDVSAAAAPELDNIQEEILS